ncbi:recombinase family protein [Patescibacteria group bacterium]
MNKYVIYARKSTESEDRQVLSIDSQINELKLLAKRQGIKVSEVLKESKSAKAPGRPVFSSLMDRMESGEVKGVLCWKF